MTMNLFKVTTKFGNIYIEQPKAEYREDPRFIRIFDSEKRFIDYIVVDEMNEAEICREWANYIAYLCNAEDFNTLLNKLVGGDENWCYHSGDMKDLLDMMEELEEWNEVHAYIKDSLMDNFGTPIPTTKIEANHVRYLLTADDNYINHDYILIIGQEIVLLYED